MLMKKPFLYRKGTHDFPRDANRLDKTVDFAAQSGDFVSCVHLVGNKQVRWQKRAAPWGWWRGLGM